MNLINELKWKIVLVRHSTLFWCACILNTGYRPYNSFAHRSLYCHCFLVENLLNRFTRVSLTLTELVLHLSSVFFLYYNLRCMNHPKKKNYCKMMHIFLFFLNFPKLNVKVCKRICTVNFFNFLFLHHFFYQKCKINYCIIGQCVNKCNLLTFCNKCVK